MTDRPILFSSAMVRAILAGTKTQTRRIVKPQADAYQQTLDTDKSRWLIKGGGSILCPYGRPGDRLWVRERMRRIGAVVGDNNRPCVIDVRYEADGFIRQDIPFPDRIKGVPKHGQCLAYGGYREASRITLGVTGVRVERLQEISEEDAKAEGIQPEPDRADRWLCPLIKDGRAGQLMIGVEDPRVAYRGLWESINGAGSWDANPLVWVVEFKRVQP